MSAHYLSWGDLDAFAVQCAAFGLELPASLAEAVRLRQVAEEHRLGGIRGPIIGMTDDDVRARIDDASLRHSTHGLERGAYEFEAQLLAEVTAAAAPEMEQIVKTLQPRFHALSVPFAKSVIKYGFTAATTSDRVVDMADEGASQAWRDAQKFFAEAQRFYAIRANVSRLFNVAPSARDQYVASAASVDYSVAFAAGDNFSEDGQFYLAGRIESGRLNWFALALGGIRLNTPAEVENRPRKPRPVAVNDDDTDD